MYEVIILQPNCYQPISDGEISNSRTATVSAAVKLSHLINQHTHTHTHTNHTQAGTQVHVNTSTVSHTLCRCSQPVWHMLHWNMARPLPRWMPKSSNWNSKDAALPKKLTITLIITQMLTFSTTSTNFRNLCCKIFHHNWHIKRSLILVIDLVIDVNNTKIKTLPGKIHVTTPVNPKQVIPALKLLICLHITL